MSWESIYITAIVFLSLGFGISDTEAPHFHKFVLWLGETLLLIGTLFFYRHLIILIEAI